MGEPGGALPARVSAGGAVRWPQTLPLPLPTPRRLSRDGRGTAVLPSSSAASFPFPRACRVGAPAPRPPSLPPLRKGPGASPRGRCGRVCGRGSAGLRHQLHCAGSGGAPGGGTALQRLRPPGPPPKKTQPRQRSPSLSALHHVSSSSSGPRAPPGRSAGSGPAPARGARGGRGAASPLPGLREELLPRPPAGERRWRGRAGRRAPSRLGDENVVWPPAGEGGGRGNGDALQQWVAAGREGRLLLRAPLPSPPAGRCPRERSASPAPAARPDSAQESQGKGWDLPGGFSLPTRAEEQLLTDL